MKNFLVAITMGLSISACSTTPDPEVICTSEWIQTRSAKAVDNILEDTQSTVRTLRKVAEAYLEGKSPNIFQMFALANKVKNLENELLRGSGIKDLKLLARTCNDPQIVRDGITSFVDRLELPQQMRAFMESLPEYKNMIEKHIRDVTS